MLLINFYLVIIIISAVPSEASDDFGKSSYILQYVNLVSDVQELFRSSSVFVVNDGNYEDLPETLLTTKLFREFSSKYVLFQNINFTKLYQEVEYYNRKTVQPLFAIMLKSMDDLHQFAEATKYYDMSLHTWLIIFMQSTDEKLTEFCKYPRENLFNLVISSKVFVKCYDSPILWDWYSLDEKNVEIFYYGIWFYRLGVKKHTNKHFLQRRSDFKGINVKVSAVKDSSLITDNLGTMNGFYGKVLKELSIMMNFTIDFVSVEDSYGSWDKSKKKWTGVIERLVARDIDVGIGAFTMTRQRISVIDYTVPLMLTTSDIYIKRPNMADIDWSVYAKAFHRDIWCLIVLTIIISPILLSIMWKISRESSYLVEEYLHVWGIYCQKPLPDFPRASSLRIAYTSMFMSSLVLFAIYSAYLTSFLTVFTPNIPFNTFEGFVKDKTYKLIVLKHSSNHDLFTRIQVSIFNKMGKLLVSEKELPQEIFSAVNQVCNEKVVLYANQLFIEQISWYSPCKLMSLTQGRLDSVGFALAKNSPYREFFDFNLKSLRAFGITECLKRRYFKKFVYNDSRYLPVTFGQIIPIIGIWCLGLLLALKLLICECLVYLKKYTVDQKSATFKDENTVKIECEKVEQLLFD